jgi:hypothetical protein
MEERLVKRPWLRAFINAFIILHVYIIVIWGLPSSRFRYVMTQPVQSYVLQTGLWQSWDMFSPEPLSLNFTVEAHIRFRDGSTNVWEFPRMEKLGIWERFQKERYRKWRERIRQDSYGIAWNDTARFVARLHNNPANPPVKVTLVRHWQAITPPALRPGTLDAKDYQPIAKDPDFKFNFRFKEYDVKPEDL